VALEWLSRLTGLERESSVNRDFEILRHQEYVDTLPRDGLLSPLFYTEEELGLLRGTNLYHATIERRRELQAGWQQARGWLHGSLVLNEDEFTW